jgi:hypothetical protein
VSRASDTADDIQAAAAAAGSGADVDAAYPPAPGRQCGWCDFRRHCPAGRAAGPEQAPWSGLADPVTAPPAPGED